SSGRRKFVFRGGRFAAFAKCPVNGEMIVIEQAGDIDPGQRNILAVADLERKGNTWIRNRARIAKVSTWGAHRGYGKRSQGQQQCPGHGDCTKRRGISPETD